MIRLEHFVHVFEAVTTISSRTPAVAAELNMPTATAAVVDNRCFFRHENPPFPVKLVRVN